MLSGATLDYNAQRCIRERHQQQFEDVLAYYFSIAAAGGVDRLRFY